MMKRIGLGLLVVLIAISAFGQDYRVQLEVGRPHLPEGNFISSYANGRIAFGASYTMLRFQGFRAALNLNTSYFGLRRDPADAAVKAVKHYAIEPGMTFRYALPVLRNLNFTLGIQYVLWNLNFHYTKDSPFWPSYHDAMRGIGGSVGAQYWILKRFYLYSAFRFHHLQLQPQALNIAYNRNIKAFALGVGLNLVPVKVKCSNKAW